MLLNVPPVCADIGPFSISELIIPNPKVLMSLSFNCSGQAILDTHNVEKIQVFLINRFVRELHQY